MFKSFQKLLDKNPLWLKEELNNSFLFLKKRMEKKVPILWKFFQDLSEVINCMNKESSYKDSVENDLLESLTKLDSKLFDTKKSDIEWTMITRNMLVMNLVKNFKSNSRYKSLDYVENMDIDQRELFQFLIEQAKRFFELSNDKNNEQVSKFIFDYNYTDQHHTYNTTKIFQWAINIWLYRLYAQEPDFRINESMILNMFKEDFNAYKKPLKILKLMEYYDEKRLAWWKLDYGNMLNIKKDMLSISLQLMDNMITKGDVASKYLKYILQIIDQTGFDLILNTKLSNILKQKLIENILIDVVSNEQIIWQYNNLSGNKRSLYGNKIESIKVILDWMEEWADKADTIYIIKDSIRKSKLKNSIIKKDFLNDIWFSLLK